MAHLSRWAIFVRAFLIALLAGAPAKVAEATTDEMSAWASAAQSDTIDGYYSYLSRYPTGQHVDRAISALIRLGAISQAPRARQVPQAATPRQAPAARPAAPNRPAETGGGRLY